MNRWIEEEQHAGSVSGKNDNIDATKKRVSGSFDVTRPWVLASLT